MAKTQLHGFGEGTHGITTGDPIKSGDHRRDKRWCKHYMNNYCNCKSQKCCGSSHCERYDDGIEVFKETDTSSYKILKNRMNNYIKQLRFRIPIHSPEGKKIVKEIMENLDLTEGDIERHEEQKARFARLQAKERQKIEEYNQSLKGKCILAGLLIVTIPFCIMYYQETKKDCAKELEKIREKTIDKQLTQKVEEYRKRVQRYPTEEVEKRYTNEDKNDLFLQKAIIFFRQKNYDNSMFYVQKSIDAHNISAVLWLAKMYKDGAFFEQSDFHAKVLCFYAEHLETRKRKLHN